MAKVKSIQRIFGSIPHAMMYVLVILLLAMGIVHLLCKFISREVADINVILINGTLNETSYFLVFSSAIYSETSNIMEFLQNKTADGSLDRCLLVFDSIN